MDIVGSALSSLYDSTASYMNLMLNNQLNYLPVAQSMPE